MIKPWQKIDSRPIADCKVFKIRQDTIQLPQNGKNHPFYIIEATDWVNVIAVTADERVILIRQYRHGVEKVMLEIPGGMIDADDPSPANAAKRELLEETGYTADTFIHIGVVDPNPAILNNRCHTFLALNAHRVGEQNLDETEEISVELASLSHIPSLIVSGQISHALMVAAFYFLEQYQIEAG